MDTRRSKLRSGRRRWSPLPPRAPRCWPQTAPAAPRPGRRPAPPLRPAPTCAERAQTLLVKSLPACRGGGAKRRRGCSWYHYPRGEIAALLVGQLFDPDPHRVQLEPRDLGINIVRHVVNLSLQLARVLGDVFPAQRLVREAHVHHGRGMTFGPGEVDEPALAQEEDAASVGQPVLLYQRPHLPDPGRQLIESLEVDLGVEVTRVGEDRAVLHRLEMLAVQHVDVAGD